MEWFSMNYTQFLINELICYFEKSRYDIDEDGVILNANFQYPINEFICHLEKSRYDKRDEDGMKINEYHSMSHIWVYLYRWKESISDW